MNLRETIEVLEFLTANFSQLKPDEKMAAAWAITLADQRKADMLDAALRYVRSGHEFPPNPGTLLQLARRRAEHKTGVEAWQELRTAMSLNTYMTEPRFADEKITLGVRFLGGWYSVATMLTKDVASNRARFVEYYDQLSERERAVDDRLDTEHCVRQIDAAALEMFGGSKGLFLPSDLETEAE